METLAVTWDDIRAAIAFRRGWTRDPSNWDDDVVAAIKEAIKLGLSRMMHNAVAPGTRKVYEWSFLRQTFQFATVEDKWEYDLPQDFGSPAEPQVFFAETSRAFTPIRLMNDARILYLRSNEPDASGVPGYAAIRQKKQLGATEQGQDLLLHPVPDGAYQMKLLYNVSPHMLGDMLLHPHGGAPFARTLMLACIAEATKGIGDSEEYEAAFQDSLLAAISYDARNKGDNFGQNTDGSDGCEQRQRGTYYSTIEGEIGV